MDALVQFHDGAVTTLTDWKEQPVGSVSPPSPVEVWECLRYQCKTIGEYCAMMVVLRQQNMV